MKKLRPTPSAPTSLTPQPGWVILDSGYPHTGHGRYTILAGDPIKTLVTRDQVTCITDHSTGGVSQHSDDPLSLLQTHTPDWQSHPEAPFSGGWLGYFGYETAWHTSYPQKAPALKARDVDLPDAWWGLYPWVVIHDHADQSVWLSYPSNQPEPTSPLINQLANWPFDQQPPTIQATPIQSNMSEDDYNTAFNQVKAHITLGNCYQVNLAQRFHCHIDGSAWHTYQHLRRDNPAQYGAFIQLNAQQAVLSLSPELLLDAQNGQITTCPIKGTRPRDISPEQDQQQRDALASSRKDQAENVMIVDLMRNDLSHHCKPGSVKVPALFAIESLPAVHHLVSTITGELAEPDQIWALLRACLPGGSITGAPKLSAMQIINALEPSRRNVYCGNIGWLSSNGNCRLNIAIRTAMWDDGNFYCHAGGGLVADSTAAAEYQETFSKVAKIMACLTT